MVAVIEERAVRGLREVALLTFTACALFLLISLLTYSNEDAGWTHSGTGQAIANSCGVVGAWVSDFLLSIFGLLAYLFPVMIFWHGYMLFRQKKLAENRWMLALRWFGFFSTLISGTAILYLHLLRSRVELPGTSGGILGQEIGDLLVASFKNSGATLILLALLLAGITLWTRLSWLWLVDVVGKYTLIGCSLIYEKVLDFWYTRRESHEAVPEEVMTPKPARDKPQKLLKRKQPTLKIAPPISEPEISDRALKEQQMDLFDDVKEGALPALSLLDNRSTQVNRYSNSDLEEMSRLVEDILQDFNVVVEVVAVHPGPVITRFELQPAAGVKVSRISGLAKDLARALSVTSVRIVEVIPGKTVIGLEIPNQEREMITLREVLASRNYEKSKSPMTLVLGKDISGVPVVADLCKMPHALVAGTTGSGKSVAINTMILSILYKATPEQVRMIMVDPKMLELSVYEGIPHLLTPVVTDMKDAANALRWSVAEMERRYKLMSKMGVRNLAGFNKLIDEAAAKGETIRDPLFVLDRPLEEGEEFPVLEKLPSIVIIIDELADMMMIVGKKVEELIENK